MSRPTVDPSGAYFVSVAEFGRRCALGRSTAYELVHRGEVRTVREGTRHLVPIAEVERYARRKLDAAGIESENSTAPAGVAGAVIEFPAEAKRQEARDAS